MSVAVVGQVPPLTLGWRLKMSLAQADMSVQEMADELGVVRATVTRWTHDQIQPKPMVLKVWALRTGVPLAWLVTGEAPTSPSGPEGEEYTSRDSNPEPADMESGGVVVELDAYRRTSTASEVAA